MKKIVYFILMIILLTEAEAKADFPFFQKLGGIPPLQRKQDDRPDGPDIVKLFDVHAPVTGLTISSNYKYLAVRTLQERFEQPNPQTGMRLNRKVEVWNIEYNEPFKEAESELSPLSWVMDSAFGDDGRSFYVSDYSFQRTAMPGSMSGPVNVRKIDLEQKEHYHSLLTDIGFQRIRLFKGNKWFACQTWNGTWRLINVKDNNRIVNFPDIDITRAPEFNLADKNESESKNKKEKSTKVKEASKEEIKKEIKKELIEDIKELNTNSRTIPEDNDWSKNEKDPSDDKKEFSKSMDPKPENRRKVVDILAVSESGDLAAALVSDGGKVYDDNFSLDINTSVPRMIVIWDLKVVSTIDYKKLDIPLEAIEVSRFYVEDGVEPRKCVFSKTGTMIAVRSKSRYIGIWETAGGRLLSELGEHKQNIRAVDFSPNNLKIVVATGGDRAKLVLWDIRKETVHRIYEEQNPEVKNITAVTFDPDSKIVYYGNDLGEIKSWDVSKKIKNEEK